MMKKETMSNNTSNSLLQQVISFLLGASVASVLLFFILSSEQGSRYFDRSAWSRSNDVTHETTGPDIVQVVVDVKVPPKDEKNEAQVLTKQEVPRKEEVNGTHVSVKEEENYDDFEELLKKTATKDKNIIMTSVNEAWAAPGSLLDLFLESFRNGEKINQFLNHLIIVTLDPNAFERCKLVHRYCYFLRGANFSGEKVYMTSEYLDLVWTKVKLQQKILELGYNFLFTDVDIMWFRNPFNRFALDSDISTSCDFFFGDEKNPVNFPNTGFLYVKSSQKNIDLFNYWHESREKFPGNHEQYVFNQIKFDVVHKMKINVQFLSTQFNMGFCNNTHEFEKLYTMHANCCVGIGAKLHDLRSLMDDWNQYQTLTEEEKKNGPVSWRVPGICMH